MIGTVVLNEVIILYYRLLIKKLPDNFFFINSLSVLRTDFLTDISLRILTMCYEKLSLK